MKLLSVLGRRAKLYGVMKPCERHAEKILIIIRIAFPGRDFDYTLHSVDFSIRPMVNRLGQKLLHSVRFKISAQRLIEIGSWFFSEVIRRTGYRYL